MDLTAFRTYAIHAHRLLTSGAGGNLPEEWARLWFIRLAALQILEIRGMPFVHKHAAMREYLLAASRFGGEYIDFFSLPAGEPPAEDVLSSLWEDAPPITEETPPEILGWLYQFFQSDKRKEIMRDLRRNIKLSAATIPAATQTFTPRWITRYLTQNTLAFLCPGVEGEFLIRSQHSARKAENITILDPCMGTGHILADAFDGLMKLYERSGTDHAQAARQILEQNLWGLELDGTACALAKLILRIKAAAYDASLFTAPIRWNLESFSGLPDDPEFRDASVLGSLLKPCPRKGSGILPRLSSILNRTYDGVITNPPYMGSSNMDKTLSGYIRTHYPDSKADLCAVFMERCGELTAPDGCFAMITQYAWMFLSSFSNLRKKMEQYPLQSLLYLGAGAFSKADVGTIVQTCAFVRGGKNTPDGPAVYVQLSDAEDKEDAFPEQERRYICSKERFSAIPGHPLCFWVSDRMLRALKAPRLSRYCRICQGMTTSDNGRFVRRWYEVPKSHIAFGCPDADSAVRSGKTWFPYNKGGRFRKWYGNNLYIVNYRNNGEEMRAFHERLNKRHAGGRIKNADMYFRPAVTWPFITENTRFGVRYQPEGFLFDVSGSSLFPPEEQCFYLMGLLSSKVAAAILQLYNPTMNFQVENIGNLPCIWDRSRYGEIRALVESCISIAREDWDSRELSWDFTIHPLAMSGCHLIADAYARWCRNCQERWEQMKNCEHRLNQIFLDIYGLSEEISSAPDSITLSVPSLQSSVPEFLQFAVGCYFGRYQMEGIAAHKGCFLPLQDLSWLEDFLTAVYGKSTLEENLSFIAHVLDRGCEDPRSAVLRYMQGDFYKYHCRMYSRRPIYFMAVSGRRKSLSGLIYLHRMETGWEEDIRHAWKKRYGEIENALSHPENAHHAQLLRRELEELDTFGNALAALSGTCWDAKGGSAANHSRFSSILRKIL